MNERIRRCCRAGPTDFMAGKVAARSSWGPLRAARPQRCRRGEVSGAGGGVPLLLQASRNDCAVGSAEIPSEPCGQADDQDTDGHDRGPSDTRDASPGGPAARPCGLACQSSGATFEPAGSRTAAGALVPRERDRRSRRGAEWGGGEKGLREAREGRGSKGEVCR